MTGKPELVIRAQAVIGEGPVWDMQDQLLYRLGLDHTARKVFDGVSISNGIAWTRDDTIMYYVDSARRTA